MFCRCFFRFLFFPSFKNMRQPFSGTAERIFMKLLPNDRGECSLKRRAADWRKSCRRLAMLIGVIYAMTLLLDMANPGQRVTL